LLLLWDGGRAAAYGTMTTKGRMRGRDKRTCTSQRLALLQQKVMTTEGTVTGTMVQRDPDGERRRITEKEGERDGEIKKCGECD
jgi:hypothetical protein